MNIVLYMNISDNLRDTLYHYITTNKVLTLILPEPKVISLYHQYRASLHIHAVW